MERIKRRINEILETINYLEKTYIETLDNFDLTPDQVERKLNRIDIELLCNYRILARYTKRLTEKQEG